MTRSAAGSRVGATSASISSTRTPRRRSRFAAARPSAPLLPFPASTTTRRPYPPPRSASAWCATAAPARSMSTSTGSGAAASTAAISSGVRIGITSATAMASANRWVWVIVSRHDRMPRSSASSCARPCNTIDGAPLSARATSISRQPQAPIPTPIAFRTASFAANRAA